MLNCLYFDSTIFPIHSNVSIILHYLILHQSQLLSHFHRLSLMFQKVLAHLINNSFPQFNFVFGFLQLFLQVQNFVIFSIDHLFCLELLILKLILLRKQS